MAKVKNKVSAGNELLENPDVLAEKLSKSEEFIEKNRNWVIIIAAVLVLGVGGYFAYTYYQQKNNSEAVAAMFQAEYYFQQDSLKLALEGDGNYLGFLEIVEDYSGTKAAELAQFYIGAAYLKQGNFEESINYLNDFNPKDIVVHGRKLCLIGDAYMELNDFENAAKFYQQAADYKSNEFFTPQYLMKAALAYEKGGDKQAAIACYETIEKQYFDSNLFQDAKKSKARLEFGS